MLHSLLTLNFITAEEKLHRRLCEWYLTVVMLLAGVVLVSSTTFDLPPYEVVRKIAPQATWAWAMLLIGAVRFAVLMINGRWSGTPHFRSGLATLSSTLWAVMLGGLLTYAVPLLLGPFLSMAVLFDMINAYRAAQDARLEDELRREKNGTTG